MRDRKASKCYIIGYLQEKYGDRYKLKCLYKDGGSRLPYMVTLKNSDGVLLHCEKSLGRIIDRINYVEGLTGSLEHTV